MCMYTYIYIYIYIRGYRPNKTLAPVTRADKESSGSGAIQPIRKSTIWIWREFTSGGFRQASMLKLNELSAMKGNS